MTKKIILIIALIILLVAVTRGSPPTTKWYSLEPWEIEFCHKWGGKQYPSEVEINSEYFAYGAASLTMQAKKVLAGNDTYYEVGYYIEPYAEEMYFELFLINSKKGTSERIDSGVLAPGAGRSRYETYYLPEEYTHLKLIHSKGELQVPIITVQEE